MDSRQEVTAVMDEAFTSCYSGDNSEIRKNLVCYIAVLEDSILRMISISPTNKDQVLYLLSCFLEGNRQHTNVNEENQNVE